MTSAETDNNSLGIELESLTSCPGCSSGKLQPLFTAADTLHQLPGEWGVHRCRRSGTRSRSVAVRAVFFYSSPTWTGALRGWNHRWRRPKHSDRRSSHWSKTGTINSADFDLGTFDLIVAIIVLSHLHDSFAGARRLHTWLRPGGHLMGSIPNRASWEFRFFGPDWYALQVPTHLFHFTPATLRHLLEVAGFSKVQIFQQRNVNNLMVHAGLFLARHKLPFAETFLAFPERGSWPLRYAVRPAASLLAWLRQAGRITFTAQKL